jgi:hypothetical protein
VKKLTYSLILLAAFGANTLFAQDEGEAIDASKPTNFYSMLDNTLENTSSPGQNVMGYRGKLVLAPSEAHLILAEVPLLYNDRTNKFGVGDLRARYFWLPYKNYDKVFGAFGPSIDIFAPTGSFENGIGSGRWTISPGLSAGIMVADWIQFFPIVSYQYASKPVYDNPPADMDKATSGITFQVLTPVVFSDKFFMQITPIYRMNDLGDERQDRYVQELFAAYSITPTMQLTAFYNGNFKDEIQQVSVGLTIFL